MTKDINSLLKTLIGKDKVTAANLCKQSGLTPRMVREDSKYFAITCDFRFDRVDLEYDNGVVTKAEIG